MLIAYDNMGRMGYSVDFGSVRAGKEDRMLHLIEVTFATVGRLGQLTWPLEIAQRFRLSPEQEEFDKIAVRNADEREKVSIRVSRS